VTYPLGYPLALSGASRDARNGRGSVPVRPTKDLGPSSRLSARKVAAIGERLSARDHEVLETVSRFRVMSGEQLQRLYWTEGSPQTRARLARHGLGRLSELGVLAPLSRRVGGVRAGSRGLSFAVGLAGQRLLGGGSGRRVRRPYTPGERYLAHTLAVAGVYVELVEAQRWGLADVLACDPEPGCWRPYLGPYGARAVLKPDADLELGVGDYTVSWLLELDMATESLATIERKARRHLDYHRSGEAQRTRGVSPRVAWVVPDEQRAEALRAALDRLPAEARRLFAVAARAEAVALLTAGVQA
jgi:Replication-relaxation